MDDARIAQGSVGAQRPGEARETRECCSCHGAGSVLMDAEYDFATGELSQEATTCFICKGVGSVSVFLYADRC